MQNELTRKQRKFELLQNRVAALEQQIAEAKAAMHALATPQENQVYATTAPEIEEQNEPVKRGEDPIASEEHFRQAILVAPYPLMIRRADGKVVMINAAWTEITGYTLEDTPTIEEWARKAYGEQGPQRQSFILAEGSSQSSLKKWGEFEVTTRSGEKRIWDFSTAPLGVDENGRQLVMTIAVDITDRKRVEEALRASEAKYRNLVETAFEGVWAVDTNGRTTFVNRRMAEMLKYDSPDDLMDRSAFDFVPPEDLDEAKATFQMRLSKNIPEQYNVRLRCRDGSILWVSSTANNVLDENGNLTGRMALFIDITERKQAEEALQASEAKLRAMFHALMEGVVFLNLKAEVEDVNDTVQRDYGHEVQELRDPKLNPRLRIIRPDGTPFPVDEQPAMVALHTGQAVRNVELGVPMPDGRVSWRLANAQPVYNERGDLLGAVASFFDITERKQFEIALRKRESILAQAGEMAHLGAWDIELANQDDVNANPLAWSDEVYRIFGYAPGEVTPSNDLFFERVHPDDRELIQESIAQAIAARQSYRIEHRICRPDGEERVVQEHAEIFFDESGKPTRIVGAVQDITERKRAEQALRESEERFRSLADSMPQLVWTALPDGTVDYYNQRYKEYHEIKHIDDKAWEWAPVLHPVDLEPTVNAWQQAVATGESYQIEHQVRMADDSYRWHLSRGVPILDKGGQVLRWFGTATDIHDLKMAEAELKEYAKRLERSNKELEQFALMASHDLQEPLRKIEMFGDLLLQRAACLDDHERNYVDRMRNAAGRMRAMVTGLLQLSRVATQGKPFVPVDLSQLASEVLSDLESQVRRTHGKVDIGNLPVIEGDPIQLRQLLGNLIGNALKYYRPAIPPEVKLYAKQSAEKVEIFVADNGIGFEQKDAERIFQPFQRLVGHSQYEGSGIGLAICHRIVERHAGSISALSRPANGATFIVTLPRQHPNNIESESRKR